MMQISGRKSDAGIVAKLPVWKDARIARQSAKTGDLTKLATRL